MDSDCALPRVLVLGPSSDKWLMMVSYLMAFEDVNHFHMVDTYCGVAHGALIALLLIVGYNCRQIVGLFNALDVFKDYFSSSPIISNEPARKQLSKIILMKLSHVPTLYELYMMTGLTLVTVTYNMHQQCTEYLTPFTHPTLSCLDAVTNSLNVPLLHYQLFNTSNELVIDGTFANPYPVDYFDDGKTSICGIWVHRNVHARESRELTLLKINLMTRYWVTKQTTTSQCQHHLIENQSMDMVDTVVETMITTRAHDCWSGYNQGRRSIEDLQNRIQLNKTIHKSGKYTYPPYYRVENT